MWVELQRERARRQQLERQIRRAAAQAAVRVAKEREQAARARRETAKTEKERKRLYIEQRKAEAAPVIRGMLSRSRSAGRSSQALQYTARPQRGDVCSASLRNRGAPSRAAASINAGISKSGPVAARFRTSPTAARSGNRTLWRRSRGACYRHHNLQLIHRKPVSMIAVWLHAAMEEISVARRVIWPENTRLKAKCPRHVKLITWRQHAPE
jgi:hypothetical protein